MLGLNFLFGYTSDRWAGIDIGIQSPEAESLHTKLKEYKRHTKIISKRLSIETSFPISTAANNVRGHTAFCR